MHYRSLVKLSHEIAHKFGQKIEIMNLNDAFESSCDKLGVKLGQKSSYVFKIAIKTGVVDVKNNNFPKKGTLKFGVTVFMGFSTKSVPD